MEKFLAFQLFLVLWTIAYASTLMLNFYEFSSNIALKFDLILFQCFRVKLSHNTHARGGDSLGTVARRSSIVSQILRHMTRKNFTL